VATAVMLATVTTVRSLPISLPLVRKANGYVKA
jgi:hypothetical protein